MLLDDIAKNRYRVEQIIQRLMDAEDKDEMSTILQMLVREEFRMNNSRNLVSWKIPDLEKIMEVITDTKIGARIEFPSTDYK